MSEKSAIEIARDTLRAIPDQTIAFAGACALVAVADELHAVNEQLAKIDTTLELMRRTISNHP